MISLLLRHQKQALLDALASDLAAAARPSVRRRVDDSAAGMSLNVLRGYVRARAAHAVREQAHAHLHGKSRLSPADCTSIIRQAVERVSHLIVRDLAGLEIAVPVTSRKAA